MTPGKTGHFCIGSQNGSILAAKSDPGTNSLWKTLYITKPYRNNVHGAPIVPLQFISVGSTVVGTKKVYIDPTQLSACTLYKTFRYIITCQPVYACMYSYCLSLPKLIRINACIKFLLPKLIRVYMQALHYIIIWT